MKNNRRKLKKKLFKIEKFNLWLDSHKLLAFLVDFIVLLSITGLIGTVFQVIILIPSPYKHMDYMFPLYCNIFLIFARFYAYYLREVCSTKKNFKDYLEPFLYINSFIFITHLTIGIGTATHHVLPSLLSLDHRYIWFPITTYLVFFCLATLATLMIKYVEKKKGKL